MRLGATTSVIFVILLLGMKPMAFGGRTLHTQPLPFVQSGEDYLLSFHSRNGLSYDRMSRADARAFDEAVRSAIAPFLQDGHLFLSVVNLVAWGKPLAGFQTHLE